MVYCANQLVVWHSGSMDACKALLEKWSDSLLEIATRFHVLKAIGDDLHAVSRGKTFDVFNDIVWRMMFDTHHMFVIDLASWCKSVYGAGGLINTLRAHHVPRFRRKRPEFEDEAPHLRQLLEDYHRAAFSRLFPQATKPASGQDFDYLRTAVDKAFAPVVGDRDVNRAHRYDPQKTGDSKQLELSELRTILDFAEQLLNDLRLVAAHSTMAFEDLSAASATATASDLVDLLLLGGTDYMAYLTPKGADRDDLYSSMHDRHAALVAAGEPTLATHGAFFNSVPVRRALSAERFPDWFKGA